MKRIIYLFITILVLNLFTESCQKNLYNTEAPSLSITEKDALESFSVVLSQALFDSYDLRNLIKSVALETFDNDYDVLYLNIKDEYLSNGSTVREFLANYFDDDRVLKSIEECIPLLTINVPDMTWLAEDAFCCESWNASSNEIAVAYSYEGTCSDVYAVGTCVSKIEDGRVPSCAFVIVKNNDRLVPINTKAGITSYSFIDDAFDRSKSMPKTKYWHPFDPEVHYYYGERDYNPEPVEIDYLYAIAPRAVDAYELYNDSNSVQNDYIFYDINSANSVGNLRHDVRNTLFRFMINSTNLSWILDDPLDNELFRDQIETDSNGEGDLGSSYNELIGKFISEGSLEFRVDILTPTETGHISQTHEYINVRPKDLFVASIIKKEYWKNTVVKWYKDWCYSISPDSISSKWYYPTNFILPEWNLNGGASQYCLLFTEEDHSITSTYRSSYSFTTKFSMNADASIPLESGQKIGFGLSNVNETTITDSIEMNICMESDDLGQFEVSYNDPYIVGCLGDYYYLHQYGNNDGFVVFSTLPRVY